MHTPDEKPRQECEVSERNSFFHFWYDEGDEGPAEYLCLLSYLALQYFLVVSEMPFVFS